MTQFSIFIWYFRNSQHFKNNSICFSRAILLISLFCPKSVFLSCHLLWFQVEVWSLAFAVSSVDGMSIAVQWTTFIYFHGTRTTWLLTEWFILLQDLLWFVKPTLPWLLSRLKSFTSALGYNIFYLLAFKMLSNL